jgi:hypothetical protein
MRIFWSFLALLGGLVPGCNGDPGGGKLSLTLSHVSAGSLKLAWTDEGSAPEGYSIQRRGKGGTFAEISRVPSGTTEFFDSAVAFGNAYEYRVASAGRVSNEAGATTSWSRTYGGRGADSGFHIEQTRDSGFVTAGQTSSGGAWDGWVVKTTSDGDLEWEVALGEAHVDYLAHVQQTADLGYIAVGERDYDEAGGTGSAWVVRLDSVGNVLWERSYGAGGYSEAFSVHPAPDGSFLVAGVSNAFRRSYADLWLFKIDPDGNLLWQKSYGGDGYCVASTWTLRLCPLRDGGYAVACCTTAFGAGSFDFWVLRLDAAGSVIWQKAYGGEGNDGAYCIQETRDGGFLVCGDTKWSFGNDSRDFLILRLNGAGDILWQRRYGKDANRSIPRWIEVTEDGGSIVAGSAFGYDGTVHNIWILKLDENGRIEWQRMYGGPGEEYVSGMRIQPTSDKGYILAAKTNSAGTGDYDGWIFKIAGDGTIDFSPESGFFCLPLDLVDLGSWAVATVTDCTVTTTWGDATTCVSTVDHAPSQVGSQAP